MKINNFGTIDNKQINTFTLENGAISLSVINYGARIHEIKVKDENKTVDVVLGCSSIEGYIKDIFFLGATIGRYANRIGKSAFSINNEKYHLQSNEGENILHGGKNGFHSVVWDFTVINDNKIKFSYLSKDGQCGFPGNLQVDTYYSIGDNGDVIIDFEAVTDKATVVNMTNHAYFNLNGADSGDILSHSVKINSDSITEVNSALIATGNILPVDSTYDFRKVSTVGKKLTESFDNFDCNYIVSGNTAICSVEAEGDLSGIKLKVFSDQPGVQFYSGKHIDISTGKNGAEYSAYAGFCFEPQNYPDAPNHSNFPSALLNPGEKYNKRIIYSFKN